MDKYTKGDIVAPKEGEFAWEAHINGYGWYGQVTVLGVSKKKAKRLRKKIMDDLNEQGDKEDDIIYQDDTNAIDELNKDADNVLKDYISQLIEKMFDFSKKDKDEMKERWFNDTKISKK